LFFGQPKNGILAKGLEKVGILEVYGVLVLSKAADREILSYKG